MQSIPLQAVPSQQLQVVLGGQNCQLSIYLKGSWIYVDTSVNSTDISTAVIALDAVPLVPIGYTGFVGNLLFTDTQGTSNPTYDGLGARYQLLYLSAAEYASIGGN
jgi:hypothetical protein